VQKELVSRERAAASATTADVEPSTPLKKPE